MELFKSFDFAFTVFNAIQLVYLIQFNSGDSVLFSWVCSSQFVNKRIHSFVTAKIEFYVRLPVNQTGSRLGISRRNSDAEGRRSPGLRATWSFKSRIGE